MVLRLWKSIAGNLVLQLSWKRKLTTVKSKKVDISSADEGLTLETSAFLLFTMVNLRFQLIC